jgi:hypothetical protein
MANYYITHSVDGSWNYRREYSQRSPGVVEVQKIAEKLAKLVVRNQGGREVFARGSDGESRDNDDGESD